MGHQFDMKCDKTKVYVLWRLLNVVVHIFKCVNHMFQGISTKCLYFSTVAAKGRIIGLRFSFLGKQTMCLPPTHNEKYFYISIIIIELKNFVILVQKYRFDPPIIILKIF